MSMWDDEAGYDLRDPKHPAWADGQLSRADDARKRLREDPAPVMDAARVVLALEAVARAQQAVDEARRAIKDAMPS